MEKFRFISHDNHTASFNLASEEYLLKQTDGYYVYLWRNAKAVILGVNQNAFQEVNLAYAKDNGIEVIRRLTGGGAVYHDLGNICYTVIAPFDKTENNYVKFTKPVIEYLNDLGVPAEFSGRNDITVDGKKISGNAQVVFGNRIMHHGTILFSTDFDTLSNSLIQNKLKVESKGIKSIRARVTNVKDFLKTPLTADEFLEGLKDRLSKGMEKYYFTDEDNGKINSLVAEKYGKYEWNVGYSPKGKMRFDARFDFGTFILTFDMIDGKFENAEIHGDFFQTKPLNEIADKLNGKPFNEETFSFAFDEIDKYIIGAKKSYIIKALINA